MSFAQTLTKLQEFITLHNWSDKLNYETAQAFVTALAVANYKQPISSWIIHLFDDESFFYQHFALSEFEQIMLELQNKAANCLLAEEAEELINDEISEDWCLGFVAGIYCACQNVSEEMEAKIAEDMFPIAFGANLYEDDSDLAQIAANEQKSGEVLAQIPDAIIDLFILFNEEN